MPSGLAAGHDGAMDTSAGDQPAPEAAGAAKVGLWALVAMVVGSMMGAGVFSPPRRFAAETGVAGARDAAVLYRLALESAPPGTPVHAVAEEGVPFRGIAETIGRQLKLPAVSLTVQEASGHFGFLAPLVSLDSPTSSALTRKRFGWVPTHPGLIADIEEGYYFKDAV